MLYDILLMVRTFIVNRKQKLFGIILVSGLLCVGLLGLSPTKVHAATFVVNSTANDPDLVPGDGDCETTEAECTLYAAMEEVNELAGADTINFNIPGAGVHTITPNAFLPDISAGSVTIDASTQPGASCGTLVPESLPGTNTPHNLLIQIDGQDLASSAFNLNGTDEVEQTLRGFILSNLPGNSMYYTVVTSGDAISTIDCNYFGTNAAGSAASNDNTPIAIGAQGGSAIITNNLFSGFQRAPIITSSPFSEVSNNLFGADASGTQIIGNEGAVVFNSNDSEFINNVVVGSEENGVTANFANDIRFAGNYIGLGVDGAPLGNEGHGVEFSSGSSTYSVGSSDEADRNVISANGQSGVHIYNLVGDSCVTDNIDSTIRGNYIGTDTNGNATEGFGNGTSGIEVNEQAEGSCGGGSVYNHRIGGTEDGDANTIAGNTEDGIRVFDSVDTDVFSISMIQNRIFENGNLGINLAADPESTGEATDDVGPNPLNNLVVEYPTQEANNYLNAPVIDYFSLSSDNVKVHYDFTAPDVVDSEDGVALLSTDLVGYRLDFYVNDAPTDGAYDGYSQAQEYLGGFVVDGSETDASHEFANTLDVAENQVITATATILWQVIEEPDCVDDVRFGAGPPYQLSSDDCD